MHTDYEYDDNYASFMLENSSEPCSMVQLSSVFFKNTGKPNLLRFHAICRDYNWKLVYAVFPSADKDMKLFCKKYGLKKIMNYPGNDFRTVTLYMKKIPLLR